MRLYVMRHGPAEDRAATGRDFDRALTPAGRDVVGRAARALRAEGGPARVLSSPLRRARETAEIVVQSLSLDPPELHDDLAVDAGLPLDLIGALARAGTDVLLVGHQPVVEDLVRQLADPVPVPLPGGFRTALIVMLERVAPDGWHPAAVFDPYRGES
jgi:phosphohistidine phosphatase